ncbi:MAG: class I SAM-dependent methyltransferase [Melioribacteraceae bacterium]|nr:class I SAM-dependent methyltransferase [Melioribacteraceae bacterium]
MNKQEQMIEFWSKRANQYKNDPRANTNDIWLRELEIKYINQIISKNSFNSILDFGCANGYTTTKLFKLNPSLTITGIDINKEMIELAKNNIDESMEGKLNYLVKDLLNKGKISEKYDFIYCVRAIQNIESQEKQKNITNILIEMLNDGGKLLYIESYEKYYELLNKDREELGLEGLPIHKHLTLLDEEFDSYVSSKLQFISETFLASSYYLVTRLLYSKMAKENQEKIDYTHQIHEIASKLPQIGNYGPLKAMLFQKK